MVEIQGWRAVLFFPQVAAKTQITPEQYLRIKFEHQAEFVDGEVVERALPDYTPGRSEFLISLALGGLVENSPAVPWP
jgi:hypothetical protein